MANFVYKAKDSTGKLIEGTMQADSVSVVVARLQEMALFPLDIGGGKKSDELTLDSLAALRTRLFGLRIGVDERANLYRQMADLVGAGIPLARALTILTEQTANPQLRAIVSNVNKDVQGGDRLYHAMGQHKTVFRSLELSMIRAGEEGGMLDDVLNRLADYAEREKDMRDKIIASLTYPMVMVGVGSIVITVLVSFVFPRMISVYQNVNQELPMITQILMAVSNFIRKGWYIIAMVVGAGGFLFANFIKTSEGRLLWHRFLLKIPKVSDLILKREVSRFARTLGSLLQNGVPLLTSLDITEDVITNEVIRRRIAEIPERVTKGEGMAAPMRRATIFPLIVVNMIAVGEETGRLPETLLRIADSYEKHVTNEMRKVTSLIEPIIMIIMAIVVAVVVIAMLLPLVALDPSGGLN